MFSWLLEEAEVSVPDEQDTAKLGKLTKIFRSAAFWKHWILLNTNFAFSIL